MLFKILIATLAASSALKVDKKVGPALKLRGGLAGVSPDAAVTALLSLSSVNAAYITLAPEPAAAAYGMKQVTPLQVNFIETMGMMLVGLCIASFMALKGANAAQVVGVSLIPSLVNTIKMLLNGTAKKLGFPETSNVLNGAIMSATITALLGGFGDADLIIKAISGWLALNGVVAMAMPDKLAGAYGLTSMDNDTTGLMQTLGAFLTDLAVFGYAYGTGQSATKAFGLALIPGVLVQLDQMFGRKLGADIDPGPQYFWLLFYFAGFAFLFA